eukprot:TRINITY_DN1350_c0_g1_i1.p1 TRINITY_DN1350_c0_g1~~TRINITY_DN1350_c0_g1_i1.p1  ORF type:complete len:308 (-),score=43.36 TRINITY_DN1350_c0_g1_i1:145-1068(-)
MSASLGATLHPWVVTSTQFPYSVMEMSDFQVPNTVSLIDSNYALVSDCGSSYVGTVEGVEVCIQEWRLSFYLQGCDLSGLYNASLSVKCNSAVSDSTDCPTYQDPLTVSLPSEHFCPHLADKQAEMPVTATLDAFESNQEQSQPQSSWFLDQVAHFRVTLSTMLAEFTSASLLRVIISQNDEETVVYDNGLTLDGYESLNIQSTIETETTDFNSWDHIGLAFYFFDMTLSRNHFTAEQWEHSPFEITVEVEYSFENGETRRFLLASDGRSSASKIFSFQPELTVTLAQELTNKENKATYSIYLHCSH